MNKRNGSDITQVHALPNIVGHPAIQEMAQRLGTQISQLIVSSLSEMLILHSESKEHSIVRPQTPQPDPLLTVSDRAKILKVSKSKAYQILKRRELPYFSVDRTVRVRREDLDAFIRDHISK